MIRLIRVFVLCIIPLSLASAGRAQTNAVLAGGPTNGVVAPSMLATNLTLQQAAQGWINGIEGGTNKTFVLVAFGDYDSAIANKWGGGLALLHPIAALGGNVEVGPRIDWINGGFEAVSVNVTEKISVNPISSWKKLWLTPYTEQSVAYPISGKHIGPVAVPGHNFNEEPIAVLGGGATLVYEFNDSWSAGLMGGYEKWFGLPGQVLNGGPVIQGRF